MTVRFGIPFYAVVILHLSLAVLIVTYDALYYTSNGYFARGSNAFFALLAFLGFGLVFTFRVLPAYRTVISDQGVDVSYLVTVFGIKVFDRSRRAEWEEVALDWHSVGWIWGLCLVFPVGGPGARWPKTVWLSRLFTSREEALRFVVTKLPAWRISEKASKKLARMGVLV